MERTKLLTIAVVGLVLLNLIMIGLLLFGPAPLLGHGGGNRPARVIIKRLRFDASQQRTYRRLVTEHQRQTRELALESARLHQAYYELLVAEQPDSVQANRLSQRIGTNQRAQTQLNFAHFGQIKALCRPDQQADFARLVTELTQLFGQQPPPGPGPPYTNNVKNNPGQP